MNFSAAATASTEITGANAKLIPAINAAAQDGDLVTSGSYDDITKAPKWSSYVINGTTPLEDTLGEGKYGAYIEVTYKLVVTASSQALGDYKITFTKGSDYDTSGVGSNMIILNEGFGAAYTSGAKAGSDNFGATNLGTTYVTLGDENDSGTYYVRVLAWINGKTVTNTHKEALTGGKQIIVATASYVGD